jgi:hypothetical protein
MHFGRIAFPDVAMNAEPRSQNALEPLALSPVFDTEARIKSCGGAPLPHPLTLDPGLDGVRVQVRVGVENLLCEWT